MTGLSLRQLVENPGQVKSLDTLGLGRDSHTMGLGIRKKTDYLHTSGRIALPSQGPAYERLLEQRALARQPPVEPHLADSAWAALLSSGASASLSVPETNDPWAASTLAVTPDQGGVVRLALARVVRPESESIGVDGVAGARIAGGAVLTLLRAEDGRFANAWLDVEWMTSTSGLLAWLTGVAPHAVPGATKAKGRKAVTLLIHPKHSWTVDLPRLEHAAEVLDLGLRIIDRGAMDAYSARNRLTGSGGSALIIVGPNDRISQEMHNAFLASGAERRARWLTPGLRSLDEEVCEALYDVAGINAALQPLMPPPPPPTPSRPPIPISNPVDCRHHSNKRTYVLDGDTGLWWTRDDDEHAGQFKTYAESGAHLVHEYDRDSAGNPIEQKHKSEVYKDMPVSDFHGCNQPAYKHLW